MKCELQASDLKPWVVLVMAIASGLTVANVYFNQALLPSIAREFQVDAQHAGWIATCSQIGYALGILFVVPLGDQAEPRKLVRVLLLATAGCLLAASLTPWFPLLALWSALICMGTCIPQIVLPLIAGLTVPERRGRIIASIQTGLVMGILLSRTLAGSVAGQWGWRTVYGVAMLAMAGLAFTLPPLLPRRKAPAVTMSYAALLRSLWTFLRREPTLRLSCVLGACLFAGFSAFWTIVAFRLAQAPFHLDLRGIGLFALLGGASGLLTPLAGRICDRYGAPRASALAILLCILAFMTSLAYGSSYGALVVAANLVSFGLQVGQIANQARIFALPAQGHGRLNTVYMVCNFGGGALGSSLAGAVWLHHGWTGIGELGLGCSVMAAVILLIATSISRNAGATSGL